MPDRLYAAALTRSVSLIFRVSFRRKKNKEEAPGPKGKDEKKAEEKVRPTRRDRYSLIEFFPP